MANMEVFDSSLRSVIEAGGDAGVQFIRREEDGSIVPCSPNKILIASTQTLRPKCRIIPVGSQTDFKTRIGKIIDAIDQRVTSHISFKADAPVEIPVAEAIALLNMIKPTLIMEEEFDREAAIVALHHLSQQHPDENQRGKVLLWTAEDRKAARFPADTNSHTKYNSAPNTTKTEGKLMMEYAIDIPILFLLKQRGSVDKGWRDTPFYWPVIRAQLTAPTAVYTAESQV